MTALRLQIIPAALAKLPTAISGLAQARAILCVALLAWATPATAQAPAGDISGNSIFVGCKALVEDRAPTTELFSLGNLCAGMVIGLASVGQFLSPPEWRFCPPAVSDSKQLAQVVVKYIDAHPQQKQDDLRKLMLEAFHEAWPCKSGQ
jgi:hypothetical protein